MLAVAGCTLGPDFEKPDPTMPPIWAEPSPATYATTRPVAFSVAPADLSQWWNQLHDPVLSSLIDRAILANKNLTVATAAVREARFARNAQAGNLLPFVNGSASYGRSGNLGNGDDGLYRTGFDASWELDFFGRIRRGVEAANANYQSTVENRRNVLITVISDVASNYADLRGTQRQIDIANGNLKIQRRNLELVRQLQVGGLRPPLDTAQAEASVASTASAIPSLQISERQAIYALSVLTGQTPEALVDELSVPGPLPVAPLDVPIGLPSDLLRRRPDVRRAESLLHAQTALIGVAIANFFPRFDLTGSFQLTSRKPASLFDWANNAVSYGPGVTVPLFDAGILFNNLYAQNEVTDQARATYEQTVLVALQDVENAIIAYVKEYERRAALADAVTANQQALKYATSLYNNGVTDFLNVLTAQQQLFSTENALVSSDRQIVLNLIALYKALGGGWEPATTPPAYKAVPPLPPPLPATLPTVLPLPGPEGGGTFDSTDANRARDRLNP